MYSDELKNFVASLLYGSEGEPATVEEAAYTINVWKEENQELPEDLTPESLTDLWNQYIVEFRECY